MFETIIHFATVTALAMGVVPLGMLIVWGGLYALRDSDTIRNVLSNMALIAMGLILIGLSLAVLADGAFKCCT